MKQTNLKDEIDLKNIISLEFKILHNIVRSEDTKGLGGRRVEEVCLNNYYSCSHVL